VTLTQKERLLASARMERATHHRKAGNLQEASDDYHAALQILHDVEDGEDVRFRARVWQNLSNTLEDAGQYADALSAISLAINDLRSLGPDVPRASEDLAHAYQNATNKLVNDGDYEQAREVVEPALEGFRELAAQGRDDVAEELARLQAVYALCLERLFDIPGAITAAQAAVTAFRNAPRVDAQLRAGALDMLDSRLETLRGLRDCAPGDVLSWVPHIRLKLDTGGALLRERSVEPAARFFGDALTAAAYLAQRSAPRQLLELLAEAGVSLAMAAYYGGRPLLLWRGGRFALDARRQLVDDTGERDQLDQLGRTYASIASMLVFLEKEEAADSLLGEMREVVGAYDAGAAREAEQEASRLMQEARTSRV
jgi:tetratricopeptide (TPR) repeat protein